MSAILAGGEGGAGCALRRLRLPRYVNDDGGRGTPQSPPEVVESLIAVEHPELSDPLIA